MMNSCRVFFLCIDLKLYCTKFKLHCTELKLFCTDLKLCCTEFKLHCTMFKLCCTEFKSYYTALKLCCTKLKLHCIDFKLHCMKLKLHCFNLNSLIISFKQDDLYPIFEEMSLSFIFIMPDLLIFKRSISHHLVFFPFSFNSFYCFKIKFCIKAFGCRIIIKNI